jgi:glyoxalase family protein
MSTIEGLHHITAIARDAQRNLDFYRNILGQRLVKRTVNFDDPGTYHLYFADAAGTPGTVLTFFPWQGIKRGARGSGAANALAYHAPSGSLGFWQELLKHQNIPTQLEQRFGENVLAFDDPDGLRIELVESPLRGDVAAWQEGPIDPRYALQGFHSTRLWLNQPEPTVNLLTQVMGYSLTGQENNSYRLTGRNGALGSIVDILHTQGNNHAILGSGSIHHVAFRVPDDKTQLDYQAALVTADQQVTPVQDRNYFHSIYFREPGGVLFEIATNNPGFAVDEPREQLGDTLKLPQWLEPQRKAIQAILPELTLKPFAEVEHE